VKEKTNGLEEELTFLFDPPQALPFPRIMTKTQATDIHVTQQGAPLCTHLTQELEYLTLSDEGELTGTYHCCACGNAMDRIYKVRP
jgi:hypothetical protein